MLNNYSFIYHFDVKNDYLEINFHESFDTFQSMRIKNIEVITANGKIVKYIIHNLKDILKIKFDGLIHYPSHPLVDVINTLLENAKLEKLDYLKESGFVIGQVVEKKEHKLVINIGREIEIESDTEIENKTYVVIGKPNTMIEDGVILTCPHLCTYKELQIGEEDNILSFVGEENLIGTDFFITEEK